MFDSKAIEFIYQQAQRHDLKSRVTDIVGAQKLPAGWVMVEQQDGSIKPMELPLPPRIHQASTITTLVEIAVGRQADESEIWIHGNFVQLVFDASAGAQPSDRVNLAYHFSKPFELIRSWGSSNGVALSQTELILLLRTTLHNCFPSHPGLLSLLRKIDTRKAQEATGVVERMGVSISKRLVAEVSGMESLPETLLLEVPTLEERHFRVQIGCAFEFDPQAEKFRIVPYPGEIASALAKSDENIELEIRQAMSEQGVGYSIYHGSY